MLYLLQKTFSAWLADHGLGWLRIFRVLGFQTLIALVVSFLFVILLGPRVIAWLRKQKIGDLSKFDQAAMDELMASKKGTPTMGGLLIIAGITFATLLLADLSNFYVRMALISLLWLGALGAVDDWLKLTVGRRQGSRQGLTSREKLIFQLGLGALLAWFTYQYGTDVEDAREFFVPFWKDVHFTLSLPVYIVIAMLVMTGTSNAVNLTDGLDGLSAGCMAITSFVFMVIGILIGKEPLADYLNLPKIVPAGQMAVFAAAMMGACLGFLWFNCNPAKVFMGDTGSLALGGLIGYVAIVLRHELVLVVAGGVFVTEALSVLIQVSYFKYSRKRFGEGRRIFLMAPLHHHFQKKGWGETQVVVRFWLIGAMLAAIALATVALR